ncbi:MAG TPA: hypothetical protein VI451_17095 [Anaerolineales bacterium]|nr:hypothetical protein [Anaerolineales bacterium]
MSSNFEWQKHQVNERIQGALQDAASHRLSREGSRGKSFLAFSFKAVFLLGIVWFFIGLLLASCTPVEPAIAVNTHSQTDVQPGAPSTLSMAEKIRFQDRLWEQALANGGFKPVKTTPAWTMADRIRFQDRLENYP